MTIKPAPPYLGIRRSPQVRWVCSNLFVVEDLRSQGIGSQLLAAMEGHAAADGSR